MGEPFLPSAFLFPPPLLSFITPELFDISLFLSFGRSLDLNVHKPLELQRYTSISIPSSSFLLTVASYSPVFKQMITVMLSALQSSKKRC